MFSFSTNYVRIAVDRLGGPTKAAHQMGVSNATIHNWINKQAISDIDKARRLGDLVDLTAEQLRIVR